MAKATVFNPQTGQRQVVTVGQPIPTGFQLETNLSSHPAENAQNVHDIGGTSYGYIPPATKNPTPTPPSPAPSPAPIQASPTPTPTPPAVISNPTFDFKLTPDQIAEQKAREQWLALNAADTGPVDANEIYKRKLAQQQDAIDAINQLYADQLNKALAAQAVTARGRVGTNTAIQARSGQLGSDFGAAATDVINTGNMNEANAISAEINNRKQEAIQAVLGNVRASADEEFKAKTAAQRQGADALVEYYAKLPERKAASVANVVSQLLAQGVDPENMSPDQVRAIADQLKVSVNDITSVYKEKKKAKDIEDKNTLLAQQKAEAELKKSQALEVSPNASVYDYATGTFKQAPAAPEKPNDLEVAKLIFNNVADFNKLDPQAQQNTADTLGISVESLRNLGASARNKLAQEAANDRQAKDAFSQSIQLANLALRAPAGTKLAVGDETVSGLKTTKGKGSTKSSSSSKKGKSALDTALAGYPQAFRAYVLSLAGRMTIDPASVGNIYTRWTKENETKKSSGKTQSAADKLREALNK